MGKQILAALACIALTFTTWTIPASAIVASGSMGGFAEDTGIRFTGDTGVVLMPFLLSAVAAFCAFAGLFYLKSLYGTMVIGFINAFWISLFLILSTPLLPALAGMVTSLVTAGLMGGGIWMLLRWIYTPDLVDANVEKEFA